MPHHPGDIEPNADVSTSPGWIEGVELLASAVVNTVRESLLVLDGRLIVCFANRTFYLTFQVSPQETLGRAVYALGNGQWDIPELRRLLEQTPLNDSFQGFEITHSFPDIGRKSMRLNARKLSRGRESDLILLAIEDITEFGQAQDILDAQTQRLRELLEEKEMLVREMHHRVKNNLQAIISLLSLQAGSSNDDAVVAALSAAQGRMRTIARLHERLSVSANPAKVDCGEYIRQIVQELEILHSRPGINIEVHADPLVLDFARCIPLGLITNELVTNSFKHAFPALSTGAITVSLNLVPHHGAVGSSERADYALIVRHNGIVLQPGINIRTATSMGLRMINLLAEQLHGTFGGPTHVIVDEHGSYRAAWSGNRLGRSLGTNVRFRRAAI